jgi:hypothetical protein
VNTWTLGLDSWIIQDGNYGEFSTGQVAELAVEYWAEDGLRQSDTPTAHRSEALIDATYDIDADVVFNNDRVTVIDLGLSAYRENHGTGEGSFPTGTTVHGQVSLGVDPFFYFERLSKVPELPPLIYTWTITRIRCQTAPFKQADAAGKGLVRDESQWGWAEISRTDAWHDDGGRATYLLDCELQPVAPKRISSTAAH